MTGQKIQLPPVTRDEYNHMMRILGEPGYIGPRSLGHGLNGAGVIELRARFTLADPARRPYNPSTADV
jgi:hypothetical protein